MGHNSFASFERSFESPKIIQFMSLLNGDDCVHVFGSLGGNALGVFISLTVCASTRYLDYKMFS